METIFSLNPAGASVDPHGGKPRAVAPPDHSALDLSSQFSTASGVLSTIPVPDDAPAEYVKDERVKTFWRFIERMVLSLACVATAVALPGFGQLMSLIGSFTTFMICVLLPVSV